MSPGRSPFTTFPSFQWVAAPAAPAGTMARSELPWATTCGKPARSTIAGTMMLPPPTPIIPERKPANTPVESRAAASPPGPPGLMEAPSQGRASRMAATTRRKAPKERFSFHSGSTWAYRAPKRAVKVAVTARSAAAITSTRPFVA